MSTQHDYGELRPAYRTLNDPTRLLGLPVAALGGLIVAGLIGYAFLRVSPLPWKLNVSLVMICVGAPTAILALRDASTIGPGRLLAGVFAWRLRPTRIIALDPAQTVRRGGVRLASSTDVEDVDSVDVAAGELPWTDEFDHHDLDRGDATSQEAPTR